MTNIQSSNIRIAFLQEIKLFVYKAKKIDGIQRIALIGSLTTEKLNPKDIDMLVTVENELNLSQLAKMTRKMNGHVQSLNHNAEVFLSDPHHHYIGRICHWKDCGPGIRKSCDAMNCGLRMYLHDDFGSVQLDDSLIENPPLVLWPEIIINANIPADIKEYLID